MWRHSGTSCLTLPGKSPLLRNHHESVYNGAYRTPSAVAVPDRLLFGRFPMAFPAVLRSFRENPEARRLALIFAVVYFAPGMWYLPNLSLTFLLTETLHLTG